MNIDPAVLTASVPNLILQPLVENAIRHGIAPRAQPGVIEISAARENGMVRLKVCDNGVGLGAGAAGLTKGIGLANTQARLDQLYGANHSFELHSPNGGGVEVTILIPFRNGADVANET
jgi:sensor histidine kinase YesM